MSKLWFGILALALFGCGNESAVESAGGALTQSAATREGPGATSIPKYPGAETTKETPQLVELTTADDPAKVSAFYEKELGTKPMTMSGLTTIEASPGGKKTAVAITTANGKTAISIMTEK